MLDIKEDIGTIKLNVPNRASYQYLHTPILICHTYTDYLDTHPYFIAIRHTYLASINQSRFVFAVLGQKELFISLGDIRWNYLQRYKLNFPIVIVKYWQDCQYHGAL